VREIEAQRKCFEAICDEAAKVAETLTTRLDKLKLKDGKLRKRHNLQHSVDTAWSRNKLLDLKKQLSGLKDALKKESSGMKEGFIYRCSATVNAHKQSITTIPSEFSPLILTNVRGEGRRVQSNFPSFKVHLLMYPLLCPAIAFPL
jgi:hypothetical protein